MQALARLELPSLPLGQSKAVKVGDPVVVAGAGGRKRSIVARVAAKQEFAGNWEYVLDEAIFTAPAHPFWGGTAMIGRAGELLGVGSLQVQQVRESGIARAAQHDRADRSPEADPRRPAHASAGPTIRRGRGSASTRPRSTTRSWWRGCRAVGRRARPICAPATSCWRWPAAEVSDLAGFFRKVWALGKAGVEVPLTIYRDGRTVETRVTSGDRNRFLKGPSLH